MHFLGTLYADTEVVDGTADSEIYRERYDEYSGNAAFSIFENEQSSPRVEKGIRTK